MVAHSSLNNWDPGKESSIVHRSVVYFERLKHSLSHRWEASIVLVIEFLPIVMCGDADNIDTLRGTFPQGSKELER